MNILEPSSPAFDTAFAGLKTALAKTQLPTAAGGTVQSTVNDWMLMHVTEDGTVGFKHHDTRNYVFLRPDGTLVVPRTNQAFMRGEF